MENKTLVEHWQEALGIFEHRKKHGQEFPTGLYWLDQATDGIRRGEIWIIAGKTGSGKTSLGLQLARNFADNPEHSILFLSLEMKGWELATRMFCETQGEDFAEIKKGNFPEGFKKKNDIFREYIKSIDFEIYEYGYRFKEVEQIIQTAYRTKKPDVIFLDFIQLIEWRQYKEERIALTEYIRKIKQLANELNVAFVIVSQLRRLPSGVNYERPPDTIDLKGSGSLEQASDKILFVYKVTEEEEGEETEKHYINLAKNRQGETNTMEVYFDGARYRFIDIEKKRDEYREMYGI